MTGEAVTSRNRSLSYAHARALAAPIGVVIIGVLVVLLYARRVETVEVVAVLLFLPVFAALLKWDMVGGAVAGVVAAIVYTAMRWSAIEAVGFGEFSGLLLSRALGFIAFGLIGGWANQQLRGSLEKLDLYDEIDDATGLYNARFVLHETDLERARANRYQSVFSVSVIDVPQSWFSGLGRRQESRVLRGLGELLRSSVRVVDRAAQVDMGDVRRLVVILPETGPEGASVFTSKLNEQLLDWLQAHEVRGDGELTTQTIAFPGDEAELDSLRMALTAIDEREHPLVT